MEKENHVAPLFHRLFETFVWTKGLRGVRFDLHSLHSFRGCVSTLMCKWRKFKLSFSTTTFKCIQRKWNKLLKTLSLESLSNVHATHVKVMCQVSLKQLYMCGRGKIKKKSVITIFYKGICDRTQCAWDVIFK